MCDGQSFCGPTYYHIDPVAYPAHAGWQIAVATPSPLLFRLRRRLIRLLIRR